MFRQKASFFVFRINKLHATKIAIFKRYVEMPAVTRLGDICTGHGCWPPRPSVTASPNVYANMIPVHRQTDGWAVHCCKTCHASNLASGSPNVYANNLQVGRIGDPVACGSKVASGSPNVFAN